MGVFQGFSSLFPLNFESAFFGDFTSVVRLATTGSVLVDLGGGYSETFTGSFTYGADSGLNGGTVTGYSQSFGSTKIFQATGTSVPALTVLAYISNAQSLQLIQAVMAGADIVIGTGGTDVLHGYGAADTINAGGGADIVYGDDGADTLAGEGGNDTIYGGDGTDTIVFSGKAANYTIAATSGALTITDKTFVDGTDIVQQGEILRFSDKTLFALTGTDAGVARLYSAAFGRTPDAAGLAFQLDNGLHAGLTLQQLSQNFIASAEFVLKYGQGTTNAQFATALYSNVLGRIPDPGGLQVQVSALDGGLSRADMLINFGESAENRAKVLADWMVLG